MVKNGTLNLSRKGTRLGREIVSDGEWKRWVGITSPHARLVWRSHFPSLLLKSLWYASDTHNLLDNLKSLMVGMGLRGYPMKWWRGPLQSFYRKSGLCRLVSMRHLQQWVAKGKNLYHTKAVNWEGVREGGWERNKDFSEERHNPNPNPNPDPNPNQSLNPTLT